MQEDVYLKMGGLASSSGDLEGVKVHSVQKQQTESLQGINNVFYAKC